MMLSKNMFFANSRLIIWIVFCIGLIVSVLAYGRYEFKEGEKSSNLIWSTKLSEAERKANDATNELQRTANQAAQAQHDYYTKQLELSKQTSAKLAKALGATRGAVIPAAAVQLLNASEHPNMSTDARPSTGSSTAAIASDSTLEEQLTICQRNYQERYLPLAEQMRQVQSLWVTTQRAINNGSGQ